MNHDDPFADHPSESPDPPPGAPPLPAPTARGAQRGYGNCTACGADLTGSSIGGACRHCGQPIGTGSDAFGHTLRQNGFAITSLVLGILSIPACFCYGVFSIILGAIGLTFGILAGRQIVDGGYTDSSRGMALAGKICSGVGIALGLAYIVFIIVVIFWASTTAPPTPSTPAPVLPSQPTSPTPAPVAPGTR